MIKYFVPFAYFFQVHARTLIRMISWLFVYTIPVFMLSYFFYGGNNALDFILVFIIVLTITYTTYEIGYIYNDTETTKKEINPTLRLSKEEIIFYSKYSNFIYFFRIASIFLLLFLLYIVTEKFNDTLFVFFMVSLLSIVYYVYNNVRSKFNIFIALILGWIRYSIPPLSINFIFSNSLDVNIIVISFFMFPLINTVTWLTKPKYEIIWALNNLKNHDAVRIFYYLMLTLVSGLLLFFSKTYILNYLFLISIYYLVIRVLFYIALNKVNFINKSIKYARSLNYYSKK